jgi:cytochrome oxidase assembly protein ShyY1
MILKVLLWILLAWFAYKFIVNLVLPVWRVSRRMRKQMRDFQQMAQQQQKPPPAEQTPKKPASTPKAGEYIDFEEVKEK